jgi:hypothetical protein
MLQVRATTIEEEEEEEEEEEPQLVLCRWLNQEDNVV